MKQAKTEVIKGTVTLEQKRALLSLVGPIGSNLQDVVGKILTMWLYEQNHLKKYIKD